MGSAGAQDCALSRGGGTIETLTVPRVLVVIDYFLPGYKAGGTVRGVANMIEWLGDEFAFDVLTRDRDLGDQAPYKGIDHGARQRVGKAHVRYLPPGKITLGGWRAHLAHGHYDLIHLNGFFSPLTIRTLLLRKLGLLRDVPIVLMPHGEFSSGALAIKNRKKAPYIGLVKRIGLYDNLHWHVVSSYERDDLLAELPGYASHVQIAPYLPPRVAGAPLVDQRPLKEAGRANIVFLSRIAPKKNLDGALALLEGIRGDICFDIYGPIEDSNYWRQCSERIDRLPPNVQVRHRGVVPPDKTVDLFGRYHLFLFPTHGENFGYAILEALTGGCPVLVSDQTPWRDLASVQAGWDLSLADVTGFRVAIEQVVKMDATEFAMWSGAAAAFARQHTENPLAVAAVRDALLRAATQGVPGDSSGSHRHTLSRIAGTALRRTSQSSAEREQQ